jgi:hypothetical protein
MPTSWRGFDGEDDMTEADWAQRGLEQAQSMQNALPADISSADADGTPTGGCYNGDYPDSYHDQLNAQLDSDEYYEAEVEQDLNTLNNSGAQP